MTITRCCERCRHWNAIGADYGECRRFPPQCLRHHDGGFDSVFPEVFNNQLCGEFSFNHESLMELSDQEIARKQ